jgi:hypothetical protein
MNSIAHHSSSIQTAPYLALYSEVELTWPPATSMRSIIVTLKSLGCWERVAAPDCYTGTLVSGKRGKRYLALYYLALLPRYLTFST